MQSGRASWQCRGAARVVLGVVVRQVEVGVGAVEDDDVEVRVLLNQTDKLRELSDHRRCDRIDRRMRERHPAVAAATAIDPYGRPGRGPRFRTAAVARGAGVEGGHGDLLRLGVAYDD